VFLKHFKIVKWTVVSHNIMVHFIVLKPGTYVNQKSTMKLPRLILVYLLF